MTPVWLWQADGAASGGRGVTRDSGAAARARAAAAARLRSGDATVAWVEAAVTDLGQRSLFDGYYRVARWDAKVGPGGRIWWIPVSM